MVGRTRTAHAAIARLRRALDEVEVTGIQTTLPFHRCAGRATPGFAGAATLSTDWVAERVGRRRRPRQRPLAVAARRRRAAPAPRSRTGARDALPSLRRDDAPGVTLAEHGRPRAPSTGGRGDARLAVVRVERPRERDRPEATSRATIATGGERPATGPRVDVVAGDRRRLARRRRSTARRGRRRRLAVRARASRTPRRADAARAGLARRGGRRGLVGRSRSVPSSRAGSRGRGRRPATGSRPARRSSRWRR